MKTKIIYLFLLGIVSGIFLARCSSKCDCDEITYNMEAKSFVKGVNVYTGVCKSINREQGEIICVFKEGKLIKATSIFVNGSLNLTGNNNGITKVIFTRKDGKVGADLESLDNKNFEIPVHMIFTDEQLLKAGILWNGVFVTSWYLYSKPGSFVKDINGATIVEFYKEKKEINLSGVTLYIIGVEFYTDSHGCHLYFENPRNGKRAKYGPYADTPDEVIKRLKTEGPYGLFEDLGIK